VVETVGLELVTHHPVIEPFSGQGRERNFRPRDRGENALYLLAETKCRDSHRYEKPLFRRDRCDKGEQSSSPGDWVVETVGLELVTHQPVIEPVSAPLRERKFPPQRQGGKS
jgi:hypothetical protein